MMKKNLLILIALLSISSAFLVFKINKKTIIDEENLAVYVNNQLVSTIPKKGEAIYIKSVCDTDAKTSWNNDSWSLLINNLNQKTKCNLYFYQGKTVFNFDYTGAEQTFIAPVSGTYRLETWGAQGGNASYMSLQNGGSGGYSTGLINLTKNTILYVNVGGLGQTAILDEDDDLKLHGYNGGGYAAIYTDNSSHGGGGGATHIALKSGMLSILENYKNSIFIVSGGGGGASSHRSYPDYSGIGGSGGGVAGSKGYSISEKCYAFGLGGTQNQAGTYELCLNDGKSPGYYEEDELPTNPAFGLGGNYSKYISDLYYAYSGGGGGYYGGNFGYHAPGGGGSGYIGNPLLKDKVMYCYNCEESSEESTKTISTTCSEETPTSNCAKKGNGYARITLVSVND